MPQQAGYRENRKPVRRMPFTMVLVGQAMRIESVDGLLKRVDGAVTSARWASIRSARNPPKYLALSAEQVARADQEWGQRQPLAW